MACAMPRQTRRAAVAGVKAQAYLREAMTAASFCGGTGCESRQGAAGRRLAPVAGVRVPVTGASADEAKERLDMSSLVPFRSGLRLQLELRIAWALRMISAQTQRPQQHLPDKRACQTQARRGLPVQPLVRHAYS